MLTDIEIAQQSKMKPIGEIASQLGLSGEETEQYGAYKAKLPLSVIDKLSENPDGKLILVTAINPTPAGEGKTTVTIGLGQAMSILGKKAIVTLREPSLGPVMGIKGGAAGGGYSQVVPMEDINLHFTGDIHAVTAANNLLSAAIDNHLHQGNRLNIDSRRIVWKRCMDMNDRALRQIVVGLGGRNNGVPREDGFNITAASEVMAILCLATDLDDLKARLGRIIVAFTPDNQPVTAADLKIEGAMALLLKDAIKPNLVQTLEHTPVLMHGGPFANIAHGCNSAIATRMALKLADYVITEAGFGADLGAEKFFDIKCRAAGLKPDAAVIVATVRALKLHGGLGIKNLAEENPEALKKGFANLEKHIENVGLFGVPVVVCVNVFHTDTRDELELLEKLCKEAGAEIALSEAYAKGGRGSTDLARKLLDIIDNKPSEFRHLYDLKLSIKDKINTIATRIYGADSVVYSAAAERNLRRIKSLGFDKLPVCIAKTQYSLSDDPALTGRPRGFKLNVNDVVLSAGAGFVVAITGDIMTMPGLSKNPSYEAMDIRKDGSITGLF